MRIKKFKSATMREGIEAMRRELGSEAIILSSKVVIEGGDIELHEIVAGIEPEDLERHRRMLAQQDTKNAAQFTPPLAIRQAAGEILNIHPQQQPVTDSSGIQAIASTVYNPSNESARPSHESIRSIESELRSLRTAIEDIRDTSQYAFNASLPPVYRKYYRQLRDTGMSDETAGHYIGRACAIATSLNEGEVRKEISNAISQHIGIMPAITKKAACTVVAVYGAMSGSGATSALTKLAISYRLAFQATVRIITSTDSINTAAVQKAQSFGILCTPCARQSDMLPMVTQGKENTDFIFIDVSAIARSLDDDAAAIVQGLDADVVLCTIPASLGEHTANNVLRRAATLKTNGIILTKTDEASAIGGLLPALRNSTLPLAYIGTGTYIPDDIGVATAEKVIELLLGTRA
ncbi:MAG: hypothetical protein JNL32_11590 [Candidatus Kapabacteria bacterium]|nr:hypothetical protein [Candidatus Kapabacteria bacterium]